jgi:hypothetical protein
MKIRCSICHFSFRGLKTFDFIHYNAIRHENSKPFEKVPICEACKAGIFKEELDKYYWRHLK